MLVSCVLGAPVLYWCSLDNIIYLIYDGLMLQYAITMRYSYVLMVGVAGEVGEVGEVGVVGGVEEVRVVGVVGVMVAGVVGVGLD